jgi:hypothetical protein
MNSRILFGLIVGVFAAALAKPSPAPFTPLNTGLTLVADGSGPVPPLPPAFSVFVADGSGPVPPLPPQTAFRSEGSGPVARVPKSPAGPLITNNKELPLLADGSGPVPPLPPRPSMLFADGSGPVPPLPPQTVLLADGSGPVPPLPPSGSLNFVAA